MPDLIHDPKIHLLGKRPPRVEVAAAIPKMAKYLVPNLPPPVPAVDYTNGRKDFGMMLNDQLGNCTIAAPGHAIQIWTGQTLPDDVILKAYEDWDGYIAGDPLTDQGGDEIDVMNKWTKFGLGGHFLTAFVSVSPKNLVHMRKAIEIFAVMNAGIELPASAQNQKVWDVADGPAGEPGSWGGGHDIILCGYKPGMFLGVTWGMTKWMTDNFVAKYFDEGYALLSPDFDSNQIDMEALKADFAVVEN